MRRRTEGETSRDGSMRTRHVVVIVGTRPELIKMAPVYSALRSRPAMRVTLLATAQHREMLDQMCAAFGIAPDIDLDLMQPAQEPDQIMARVVARVGRALAELEPDVVLVQGDTTTCLGAALAGFYAGRPIGHVEAGLRTHDLAAPWPEEMNRRLTDSLSRWRFAPTERAAANLRAEGISEGSIHVVGNTVVDSLLVALKRVRAVPAVVPGLPASALAGRRLILVTGHRRESFGAPFREFCEALREVVETHPGTVIVYPVHLNPNVQRPAREILGGHERIHLIAPLDYLSFVGLLARCYLVITDSGGVQEEAPSLGKPVLLTRSVTARRESVELGLARLVGTSREAIVSETARLLGDPAAYAAMSRVSHPYGDGRAGERIADIIDATL
jgi:UDP-N-acetylglucosamine 2-epimerase (non-hydrolysing)